MPAQSRRRECVPSVAAVSTDHACGLALDPAVARRLFHRSPTGQPGVDYAQQWGLLERECKLEPNVPHDRQRLYERSVLAAVAGRHKGHQFVHQYAVDGGSDAPFGMG
uniref:(northern house mosquito) hypothetical protein n=1 Tax=Culex pipiens TaxID=7175 RepID=A0A8D8LEB9_CULPI